MPILNYTTQVSPMRSIGQIQGNLVAHGAKAVLIQYQDQEPSGLSFLIPTPYGDLAFQLPANIEAVHAVLQQQRVRVEVPRAMAHRVAWRILKDWVEAQMAILESEMVTMEQIFLPYMDTGGRTLYAALKEKRFYLTQGHEKDNDRRANGLGMEPTRG